MIFNLLLLIVVFLIFIIYQSFITIFSSKDSGFKNLVKLFALWGGCIIFFNIFYNIYIYYSLMNSKGFRGPRGIQGKHGPPGNKGVCTANCGQKVCISLVYEDINDYLKSKNINKMNNEYMITKIKKICLSDKYLGFLNSGDTEKPNEKTLIEYIQGKTKKWIDEILKFSNGSKFLNTPKATDSFFQKNSPFDIIKKYEIWDWGEPYKFKPITRIQYGDKENIPQLESDLDVIFTNEYEVVFFNKNNDNIYGPKDCPHDQLGKDFTNPRNISRCIYDNVTTVTPITTLSSLNSPKSLNNDDSSKQVWKRIEFIDYKKNISFYNISKTYLDKVNKNIPNKYYQVGSIWRSTNNTKRIPNSDIIGPPKNTILVRDMGNDNLKPPKKFELIWSNKIPNLNIYNNLHNRISIWRPIPPDNYVSLGDYVTDDYKEPSVDNFRCVKLNKAEEFSIDKEKIWDQTGYKIIVKDSSPTSEPIIHELKPISIYPIGITDKDDDIQNLGHKIITNIKTGGYNFFRASDSILNNSSNEKCYIIKPTSYNIDKTNSNTNTNIPIDEYGIGWLGGELRKSEYSVYKDLDKPFTPYGIIYKEDNKDKKFYIEYNDKNNSYVILQKNNNIVEYLNTSLEFNENTSNDYNNLSWDIIDTTNNGNNTYSICIKNKNNYLNYINNKFTNETNCSKWILLPSTNFIRESPSTTTSTNYYTDSDETDSS